MARQERKYHYIYKITCKITNRYYIGMHSTDNLNDGYFGSGKRLWFSINYHGKENHIKEILEYCNTRTELIKREEEIVTKELINEDLCMNLVIGGQGGGGCKNFNEEKLLAFTKAGGVACANKMKNDLEFREFKLKLLRNNTILNHKLGKIPKPPDWTGKQHSDETKKILSDLKKGTGIGKSNSQYGTCWITKDGVNKKIKKEELDKYQLEGWVKGRIKK